MIKRFSLNLLLVVNFHHLRQSRVWEEVDR